MTSLSFVMIRSNRAISKETTENTRAEQMRMREIKGDRDVKPEKIYDGQDGN